MKVIAHRGFSGRYPENTMLAFEKAVEAGCDEIELDIQTTKDGVVVVIHDEQVDRTTDGEGFVRNYTYEQLSKLNAGKLYQGQYGFNPIPSFDEYCKWAKNKNITTNIELKTSVYYYPEIEQKAIDIIRAYDLVGKVMFSSFNPISIVKCKALEPAIECGILTGNNSMINAGYFSKMCNIECYHPNINTLTDELVQDCNHYGIKLNVWTINAMSELQKLYDWQCNGVITNYPDICKAWLNTKRSNQPLQ